MQEANGHRLHSRISNSLHKRFNFRLFQLNEGLPLRRHALSNLKPELPRNKRRRPGKPSYRVNLLPVLTRDGKHVPEPFRCDQGGPRPLPLDDEVRGKSCALRECGRPESKIGQFAKARKGLESDEGLIVNGHKKDIIFVDSLTEINEKCKKQILAKDRPELLSKRKKKDVGGIYDELMVREDWGLLGTRIDSLVSAFCHLPCHFIITALEQWAKNEITGEIKLLPALNGKLANTISKHFDFSFHLEVQKIEGADRRFFRTSHSMQVAAKGSPHLNDLEEPSWTKVISKVFNAGKSAKKKASKKKAAKSAAETKGGENDGT